LKTGDLRLPIEDVLDITSRDELYQPAKGFTILKLAKSPLPKPRLYNKAIHGPKSKQWLNTMQEECKGPWPLKGLRGV
jgi:hypothetical protein